MSRYQSFPRLFTVAEARALLPTLRPLMQRIFECLDLLKSRSATVICKEGIDPDSPDLVKRLREDESVRNIMNRLEELVEEINQMGCVCKGVEQGLVDFPCMLGGEAVFLCWRYDEENIGHWHRIEEGYAGRRPLLDPKGDSRGSFH